MCFERVSINISGGVKSSDTIRGRLRLEAHLVI